MKTFYFTRYRDYRPKLRQALRFFLISDIHYSTLVKNQTLQALINAAKKRRPDYICIAGDLIDCRNEVKANTQRERLFTWIEQLGTVAPVIIVPGNHDFYLKNPLYKSGLSRSRHWFTDENPELFDALNQIPNVYLINNQAFEDDKVFILGFVPSQEYYQLDRDAERHSSLIHPGGEDKAILLRDLRHLPSELRSNLPKRKIKLALIHSPVFLRDPEVAAYLSEFDYYISGHMHNGCVPPLLNEAWKSNRGLIAPGKGLAPENARLRTKTGNKSIVLGAVTTIQKCAKPISFLNAAFPVNIAELEFTKNPAHKNTDLSFKYISFK